LDDVSSDLPAFSFPGEDSLSDDGEAVESLKVHISAVSLRDSLSDADQNLMALEIRESLNMTDAETTVEYVTQASV